MQHTHTNTTDLIQHKLNMFSKQFAFTLSWAQSSMFIQANGHKNSNDGTPRYITSRVTYVYT